MNIENKTTIIYKIAAAIYSAGPLNVEAIAAIVTDHDIAAIRKNIGKMCVECSIEKIGDVFHLQPNVRRQFASIDALQQPKAEPRTNTEWKPLSEKNKFWTVPRREPLREVSFQSGSIGYPVGFYA
jgi:hypothetical protein